MLFEKALDVKKRGTRSKSRVDVDVGTLGCGVWCEAGRVFGFGRMRDAYEAFFLSFLFKMG